MWYGAWIVASSLNGAGTDAWNRANVAERPAGTTLDCKCTPALSYWLPVIRNATWPRNVPGVSSGSWKWPRPLPHSTFPVHLPGVGLRTPTCWKSVNPKS